MGKVWKCRFCDYTTEPSELGYRRLQAHMNFSHKQGERGCDLVDQDTGEVLASSLEEARQNKVLLLSSRELKPLGRKKSKNTSPAQPPTPPTPEGGDEAEEQPREEPVVTYPEIKDGIFQYLIVLPADAWFYFNLAKAGGFEENDKIFDEWVFDCIMKRFELDYKVQLVIAPIAVEQNKK